MPEMLLEETSILMEESIDHLAKEFTKLRTGRANPAMIDSVMVEAYGMPTPLNQIASISTPEARQLLVSPFDKSIIRTAENAIRELNLPVSLSNDGNVIRLVIAPLTEETRKLTVKEVHTAAENAKIGIRNKRRDANENLKKMKKNSELTEDDLKFYLDKVQSLTNEYVAKVDKLTKEKEDIVMKV